MMRLVLTTDRYGQPCITKASKDGSLDVVFSYLSWHPSTKGRSPLQCLAREVVLGLLTNPSIGTVAQVFDALQPSPTVDEFKGHLLRELRWAQRILNNGIKHIEPE